MKQIHRVLILLAIMLVLVGSVIGLEYLRGKRLAAQVDASMEPGDIPIYWNGDLKAAFAPSDLQEMPLVSFVDAEEGKTQEDWYFREVLLSLFPETLFNESVTVTVISTTREKSATLTWSEIQEPANMVMFDLSGRGTIKLISLLEKLDVRDEWVQDVDRIEVTAK